MTTNKASKLFISIMLTVILVMNLIPVGSLVMASSKNAEPEYINQIQVIYSDALEAELADGTPWIYETHLDKSNTGYDSMSMMITHDDFKGWFENISSVKMTKDSWNEHFAGITTLIGGKVPLDKHYYSVAKDNMSPYVKQVVYTENTKLYLKFLKGNLITIYLDVPQESSPATVFELSYDANTTDEVSGMPASHSADADGKVTVSTDTPTRPNYKFEGWAYSDGPAAIGEIIITANTTLKAMWEPTEDIPPVDPVDPVDPVVPTSPLVNYYDYRLVTHYGEQVESGTINTITSSSISLFAPAEEVTYNSALYTLSSTSPASLYNIALQSGGVTEIHVYYAAKTEVIEENDTPLTDGEENEEVIEENDTPLTDGEEVIEENDTPLTDGKDDVADKEETEEINDNVTPLEQAPKTSDSAPFAMSMLIIMMALAYASKKAIKSIRNSK